MKIKVIAIDADHTLYEIFTEKAYEKFFSYLSKELDIEAETLKEVFFEKLEEIKKLKEPEKRRREYCLKKTLEKLNVKYSQDIISSSLKIFWNEVLNSLKPKKGVIDFVEKCSKNYILGVFTDEFKEIVEEKLEKVFGNWKEYFKFLITPEDVGEMKPSEKYYEKTLEITKARAEEIAVIGDSWERDLKIAKEKGMVTILIAEKKEGNPDFFVKDFEELEKSFC